MEGRRGRVEELEVVEDLLLNIRVMCLEGDAPSSTRDLVTRPWAGIPASIFNSRI